LVGWLVVLIPDYNGALKLSYSVVV